MEEEGDPHLRFHLALHPFTTLNSPRPSLPRIIPLACLCPGNRRMHRRAKLEANQIGSALHLVTPLGHLARRASALPPSLVIRKPEYLVTDPQT